MAVNTKDQIPQTHRAILFESFTDEEDDESLDLYTFLNKCAQGGSSDELKTNLARLEVRSFEEFLEKFAPKVYEYNIKAGDRLVFKYTTKRSEAPANAITIDLANHGYFRMLCNMYEQKARRGLPNLDFDDQEILAMLLPQREKSEVYNDRKLLLQSVREHEAKVARHEIAAEEAALIRKLRKKIVDKYSKSPLPLVSIALADTSYKLEKIEKSLEALNAAGPEEKGATVAIGTMSLDNDGRPCFRELPPAEGKARTDAKSQQLALADQKLKAIISSDFDNYAPANTAERVKDLVVSVYGPVLTESSSAPAVMTRPELEAAQLELRQRKEEWEAIFTDAKNSFINTLANVVQKLLCVKIFFDHATKEKGDSARLENTGLIVANCPPGKLLDPQVLDKFKFLMEHFGTVERKKKIWFGILPHVKMGPEGGAGPAFEDDPFGSLYGDEAPRKTSGEYATLSEAISILNIMNTAEIITFFNFAPDNTPENKTTFAKLDAETVEKFQDTLNSALKNNEHAVFVYPNFTLMAEKLIPLPDNEYQEIKAPAIFIDASYVAAALTVASQQEGFLKNLFRNNYQTQNVNVRVNLEEDAMANTMMTNFNCELANNWDKSLKEAINARKFGFVFCGDEKYDPVAKKELTNSYIYQARTMAKNAKGMHKPLFASLTKDFLRCYAKGFGNDKEKQKAFQAIVDDWKQQAKRDASMVNLILRPADDISSDREQPGRLVVRFDDLDDVVDLTFVENDQ